MTKSTRMLIMDRKIIVRLIEGDSFNLIARELKVGKRRIKRTVLVETFLLNRMIAKLS